MTRKTEWYLEMKKLKHRYIPLLFLLTFALIGLWMAWCLKDLDPSGTNDIPAAIYINLLLMNTILGPILFAAAASRMCDMEQLGDTYKWLCTMQKPEHIYRGKVMAGCFYLLAFTVMQVVLFTALSCRFTPQGDGLIQSLPLPANRLVGLFTSLFLTSLCIFILQLNLSVRFTNQLTPVFISIGGTFAGLFSWFLNEVPLRYLIPWGYYAVLCNTGFQYDEATRYSAYYWEAYPIFWMLVLAAAIITLYLSGRRSFLRTVRETM